MKSEKTGAIYNENIVNVKGKQLSNILYQDKYYVISIQTSIFYILITEGFSHITMEPLEGIRSTNTGVDPNRRTGQSSVREELFQLNTFLIWSSSLLLKLDFSSIYVEGNYFGYSSAFIARILLTVYRRIAVLWYPDYYVE